MSQERQEFTIACYELRPNFWFYHVIDSELETIHVHPASGPLMKLSQEALTELVEEVGKAAGLAEILDPEQDDEYVHFMAELAE